MKISIEAIGRIETSVKEQTDLHWGECVSHIIIDENLSNGLIGLSEFSHIIVLYYLNQANFIKENHLVRHPQGRIELPKVGIFSQRAKDRPNQIGITTVELVSVENNIITVKGLDAIDGTPVIDIKPYFPQYDLKSNAIVPNWVSVLMKNYF